MNQKAPKLGEVVDCAQMNMRRCSHLLDKGVVPLGEQQRMSRGHRRRFRAGQAFELVLAYRLSELGVPLRFLKTIIGLVHERFQQLKQPVSDGFCPPDDELDYRYDWCLVVSRGDWIVIAPEEYVPAWLAGGVKWFSLVRRRMEEPDRNHLRLGWLHVPLIPIAECVGGPPWSPLDFMLEEP